MPSVMWCLTSAQSQAYRRVPSKGALRTSGMLTCSWWVGAKGGAWRWTHWPLRVEDAARELKAAELRKTAIAEERCRREAWLYQAAAFSPWGMPGPSAKGLLTEISRRAVAALSGWEKIRRQGEIAQGVSVTLQQQVARQLSLRYVVQQDLADTLSD